MLRRIVQKNQGQAISRRAATTPASSKRNHSRSSIARRSVSYGDTTSSFRRDRDDGVRQQVRVATPSSTSPRTVTQSERYLSSEAALHSVPTQHNFLGGIIHTTNNNEMINPFLNSRQNQPHHDDGGFWELFKAISTLNNRHHDVIDTALAMSFPVADTDIYAEEESESTITSGVGIENATRKGPLHDVILSGEKLDKALNKSCINSVLEIFEQVRTTSEVKLSDKQLGRIITFLAEHDVAMSFEGIKHYVQNCKAEGRIAPLYLYHYIMSGLKSCANQQELERLVCDIRNHIIEEYSDGEKAVYKYILLPQLAQTVARLGYNQCARPLVEYVLDEKYPIINPDIYESLLGSARRHQFANEDWSPTLPYHRLLSELVSCGHRPQPDIVTNVLHTYYPYKDIEATMEILSSIQQLHHYEDHPYDYTVDSGTLEIISKFAAKRGSIDLSLLIIEMTESFGFSISESMFEDVILSFAASRQVPQCLGALVDMERNEYTPSRELLRNVAKKLSYDDKRLRFTQHILTGNDNEGILSTATMNCLMMGYGMKKNIQSAFDVFHSFQELGLRPDANTAAFLMEILYISTTQRFGRRIYAEDNLSPDDVNDVEGEIDIVLSMMTEENIEPTRYFYHEYVRLLCSVGLFEDAKRAVEEAVSNGITLQVGTLFLLAVQCAHRGKFEMAHDVARLSIAAGCGKQVTLIRRINNIQNQALGVRGRQNNSSEEKADE